MKGGLFITAAAAALSAVQGQKSIVETAQETDGLQYLVAAILAAPEGILTALGGDDLTVFAPTNSSFEDIGAGSDAKNTPWAHLTADFDYARSRLADVLTAHVLGSVVRSGALANGVEVPTLNPQTNLTVVTEGGAATGFGLKPKADGDVSNIEVADVDATNGVVHLIEGVIIPNSFIPNTIAGLAVDTPDLSILVEALSTAGLVDTFTNATTNPWTVFAPTNAAFGNALAALNLTKEELFGNTELLTTILQAHVMNVDCDAACVGGKQTVSTIGGEKIPIDDIKPSQTDNLCMNGIVHVVSEVIVPPSLKEDTPDDKDPEDPDNGNAASSLPVALFASTLAFFAFF